MAAVKIRPPRDARCRAYRDHLRDRVDKRQFLAPRALELNEWLMSSPEAPDLQEVPEGWHKFFDSFTICGEGDCIKTLFTIYAPGKPRRNSIDLDEWVKANWAPATR
jgi:hypothetical protein